MHTHSAAQRGQSGAAVYEIAVPFPVPIASWALPLLSVGVAALHLWGLRIEYSNPKRAAT